MPSIDEGSLRFTFPEGWDASKFDEWSFYRNQFSHLSIAEILCNKCDGVVACVSCNTKRVAGTRGIDVLTVERTTCWNIEIKDYRVTRVTNFVFLADVVALKVRDTHACLVAAKFNANDADEKRRATQALARAQMRVVLHLETPPIHNPLVNVATQRLNVLQRLKQLVKAVDAHPKVVSMADMQALPWTVTQVPP